MAVSPLVPHASSVAASSSNAGNKFENDSGTNSPNKTKRSSSPQRMKNPDREITEQLNDDVRHKYIKGTDSPSLALTPLSNIFCHFHKSFPYYLSGASITILIIANSQIRSWVRELMP